MEELFEDLFATNNVEQNTTDVDSVMYKLGLICYRCSDWYSDCDNGVQAIELPEEFILADETSFRLRAKKLCKNY